VNRNPSMFDVARHCGVSHQTVSRVINGNPHVSEKTRAKVLLAIEELGYQQNLAARALATGRAQALGVLSFDSTLYGPTAMLHSIQVAAKNRGYRVVLNSVDDIGNEAIAEGIAALATSHVDGIIVIAPRASGSRVPLTLDTKLPVRFREVLEGEHLGVVDIDQVSAGALATGHLIDLGHRSIAHISGPLSWVTAERRKQGWQNALANAALTEGELAEGDWTPASGYEAAKKLLNDRSNSAEPFTAIFVANDAMALGAYRAIKEAGLAIPEDISVVGFDDTAESAFTTPALTTVRQDFDAVGVQLLERVLEAIEGGAIAPALEQIQAQLVARESAARITTAS